MKIIQVIFKASPSHALPYCKIRNGMRPDIYIEVVDALFD